jgi:hypothetical protein
MRRDVMDGVIWSWWKSSMVALTLILATVYHVLAQDTQFNRATLAGLTGLDVIVDDMNPNAERDGLAKSALQTDVELRLRHAGIRVLTENESIAAPGSPYLHLRVMAAKNDLRMYGYSIELELKQLVRLDRDPSMRSVATTWGALVGVGIVPAGDLSHVVRERVRDAVDGFINDFLAANPKR